jgi:hypothetical protein
MRPEVETAIDCIALIADFAVRAHTEHRLDKTIAILGYLNRITDVWKVLITKGVQP